MIRLAEIESKTKILVIGGLSGSGKTFLKNSLIKKYPNIFSDILQFTTREMRIEEKDQPNYIHCNAEQFKKIKGILVGKTYFHNNWYGSYINFTDTNFINIIILNSEGLIDLKDTIKYNKNYCIRVLGLDVSNLDEVPVEREGRNQSSLQKERTFLNYADYVWDKTVKGYLTPEVAFSIVDSLFYESNPKQLKLFNE